MAADVEETDRLPVEKAQMRLMLGLAYPNCSTRTVQLTLPCGRT